MDTSCRSVDQGGEIHALRRDLIVGPAAISRYQLI